MPKNKIDILLDQEKWKQARKLILKELKKDPDNHWFLARLSTTYYEEYDYETALEVVKKALLLAPKCPLVLWDFAGCLFINDKYEEAEKIYKSLLKKGVKKIAYGKCGEGRRWAESMLNDCRIKLALIYQKSNNYNLAIRYLKCHLRYRKKGNFSIYTRQEVKNVLGVLIKRLM